MPDDFARSLLAARTALRAVSGFPMQRTLAEVAASMRWAMGFASLAEQYRRKEDMKVPVDEDETAQDETTVYAVFTDIPPEMNELDVWIGEVVKMDRGTYNAYQGLYPCVRLATPEETDRRDSEIDMSNKLAANARKLNTALLLVRSGSLHPERALCGSC